jgi:signal transduction histidine kinase
MAADTLAQALDPYFTTKGPERGTGLGLAMVRTIAESHGGCVDVASRPGTGTRVTVYLPLAAPSR